MHGRGVALADAVEQWEDDEAGGAGNSQQQEALLDVYRRAIGLE